MITIRVSGQLSGVRRAGEVRTRMRGYLRARSSAGFCVHVGKEKGHSDDKKELAWKPSRRSVDPERNSDLHHEFLPDV
jgi:hypothetical protein